MKKNFFVLMLMVGATLLYSYKGLAGEPVGNKDSAGDRIVQGADGTISLKIDMAYCYQDKENPINNTAEWNGIVLKSGRYEVWLSSLTKDTTNLRYKNPVRLNVIDKPLFLEASPSSGKIIKNSEVIYPYFRADSFMGSLYFQDAGEYSIQVISEKIVKQTPPSGDSKLLSVILTPITK